MDCTHLRESAAVVLFETGSVAIDTTEGFRIKVHESHPEAPLSPIKFNIRPIGVQGGGLSEANMSVVAEAMVAVAEDAALFGAGRYWAGIPKAGDSIAEAILRSFTYKKRNHTRRFRLIKVENSNGRRIAGVDQTSFGPPERTQNVLLVDDLVTAAHSKLEACAAIAAEGGKVTDLLVFIDRSVGARKLLLEHGVRMHAVWTFDWLLEFYLAHQYITRSQYESIVTYPERLEAHITQHS